MAYSSHFNHLQQRCEELIAKYVDPIIAAENLALQNGAPPPDPDKDQIVALRLIAHAEFEGYFEACATEYIEQLKAQGPSGQSREISALVLLYLQKKRITPYWSAKANLDDKKIRAAEISDFNKYSSEAFGFAADFIESNNGVKENSILTLGALTGKYPADLSTTLVTELNQFGTNRGAVAHKSHFFSKKANIQSATIEKNKIQSIVNLIKDAYDNGSKPPFLNSIQYRQSNPIVKILVKVGLI